MSMIPIAAQVEQLFNAALQLPEADRLAFLETTCGDDGTLFRRVSSLLAASQHAEEFLDGLSAKLGLQSVFDGDLDLPQSKAVGPYKLIRLIGRGGMGAVYLAERADQQFEKEVALKILPIGVGGAAAKQRFIVERQILARLVHPNIARLLDGGIGEQDTPYFVMDYVDGIPIDEYCDRQRLDIDARLRLFLTVTEAVAYAHRHLIVHRDIKPGNVLVEADGVAKLLDFGVAKLLTPKDDDAPLTMIGQLPMTVLYSSPEAIRGESVTTSMDIYSLGVLLYRLLTGCYPYVIDAGSAAARFEILNHHTQTASQTIATLKDKDSEQVERLARCRGTSVKVLGNRFGGDIDTILSKVLAPEPENRYASVEQLAADLRRHLDGLPVAARPPSIKYRLGKFIQRRKGVVAAATMVSTLLVAIIVLVANFALTTQRQSELIGHERDRAIQIKNLLVTTFTSSHPFNANGESVTARELLDQGAQQIDETLIDNPELHAELLMTIGDVYDGLQLFDPAKLQFEKALTIYERENGENSLKYIAALTRLTETVERIGDYVLMESLASRGVALNERVINPAGLADNLSLLARARQRQGEQDGVEAFYRRALLIRREVYGNQHELVADSLDDIGSMFVRRGDFAGAEELHKEAFHIRRNVLGDNHLNLIQSFFTLGLVARRQNRPDEAEEHYQNALALLNRVLPEGSADEGLMHNGLGFVYREKGDDAAAAIHFRRGIFFARKFLGQDHPNLGIMLANLGQVLVNQGKCEEAATILDESVKIVSASIPEHPVADRLRQSIDICESAPER